MFHLLVDTRDCTRVGHLLHSNIGQALKALWLGEKSLLKQAQEPARDAAITSIEVKAA
jgi:hypothetical protein